MANNVGRLGVVLGLDTAQFVAGLDNAGRMLEKFGNSVEKYGKMGVAAMVAAGVQALAYADELNDVAKANDTTIASVIKLQQALATNGGEAESAGKILASFTKYVDDAAQGSMDAQKRLSSMGVTLKDIATLSQQQLFDKALQGSAKTVDALTRQANAYAVFGKAMKGVDIKGVAQDYQATNAIIDEQAEKIQKGAEAWDEIKKHALETKTAIAEGVGPALLTVIQYMKSMESHGASLTDVFSISLQTVIVAGNTIIQTFKSIWDEAVHTAENAKTLLTKGIDAAIEENKRYDLYVEEQRKKRLDFEAKILGLDTYPDSRGLAGSLKKTPQESGQAGRPTIDAYEKETAQLRAKLALQQTLLAIDQKANALRLESISGDKTKIDLANVEIQLQTQLANIANARAQALANEKLNPQQRGLINADFNVQETRAREKAKTDTAYINGMNDKLLSLYQEQAFTRQVMLDIDKKIGDQQIASINMDKLQAETQANVLQLHKEILRINQQEREDLEKSGMSEIERANIKYKADDDRRKAVQEFKQANAVVTRQYQDQLEAVGRLSMAQDEAYAFDVRRQILEQNKYHMRQDEIKLAEEEITSEQKIAELRRQQMEVQRTMGQGDLANAESQRIENLIIQEETLSKARKQAIKDEYERQQSFQYGWDEAFKNYTESAINAATMGAQTFNAAVGNMNSALDKFVDTGKFSFEDLTNSIIKDLIKIQLKAAAMSVYGDVGNSVVGFMSGLFGKRVGGPAPVENRDFTGSSFTGEAFADGGSPTVGMASLVGERGPELFIPRTSGTIIPNGSLASAMGGGGQTINYNGPFIANMSAIDTQTGVQFLAKNKQTIWASYQSANRSVPVSR